MSALLRQVIKQAERLLGKRTPDAIDPLEYLKPLVARLSFQDLNLEEAYRQLDRSIYRAPVGYMQIYESSAFIISVFILNGQNSKLPLHDHPSMHGLIKALDGRMRINSYSLADRRTLEALDDRVGRPPTDSSILTVAEGTKTISASSEPRETTCSLSPTKGNYHEIANISETKSAFFDILTPPYHSENHCHYYRRTETGIRHPSLDLELVWLTEIPEPEDFFTYPIQFLPNHPEEKGVDESTFGDHHHRN